VRTKEVSVGKGVEVYGRAEVQGKPDAEVEQLQKRVADLEQLAGDQALAIRILKKTRGHG